jgi:hypothetical protein
MIMKIEKILEELAEGFPCVIQKEIELNEEAKMYHFVCDNIIEAACIVYNDGTLFHQWDWQSGRPNTFEEIEEYMWCSVDGRQAIVLNGLPRLLV